MNRSSFGILCTTISLALAACGGPDFTAGGRPLPTPDDPGLYALEDGDELRRIDGSPEWERETWPSRADFDPTIEFIVYDPALADSSAGESVTLWRVAWLRSELDPSGQAAPVSGSQWVVAGLQDDGVPMAATRHPENPGIFHLSPSDRLGPGLYELRAAPPGGPVRSGRIGVLWSSIDERQYSAAHCVDRVVGGQRRFQPCTAPASTMARAQSAGAPAAQSSATPVQPAARGLSIELADPVQERGGLTIRGLVVNTSSSAQTVPTLEGTIFDASGNSTDRWRFAVLRTRIAPGEQVAFTTWRPTPVGAARINVDFARN